MNFDLTLTRSELIIRPTDGTLTAYFTVPATQVDALVATIMSGDEAGNYAWHASNGRDGWQLMFGHGNTFWKIGHRQALDLARAILAARGGIAA